MKLWVARDKDGELWLYGSMPIREACSFVNMDYVSGAILLNETLYPEITWENSPQAIEI